MPRMQLTDEEAQLIAEHRRKTEIDRTHNVALDAAAVLLEELLEETSSFGAVDRVDFLVQFKDKLHQHKRQLR